MIVEALIERGAGVRALLATVGHELRTPLASIRGYIETLIEGDLDAQTQRRFLETARRETLRLGRLVEALQALTLLDLSAAPSAGCDVAEQIRATIEVLAPLAAGRRMAVRAHLPPSARAQVDADACVHALANLLDNALKYGSEGGTIAVACACEGRFVRVSVEDDGCGVEPAERERIFGMGVRGAGPRCAGAGIGLAVVKAIAERSGGDVRVERSSLGGARFVLRLPAG